eukprot:gnl/TRDRNA2_/TRDRNA2_36136_c0_seq1.p1 gnl/TRDRNA2_/TRDRNA2_36136_c0~~gnl/TRDRNA2_/TRDRNA2_36136_c0_seq1.p1  ORF type:complete len:541 (+),score=100.04 gnl/TRDRNA2_/TRDRNA2_36136_c0_seq1:128-1750(+)
MRVSVTRWLLAVVCLELRGVPAQIYQFEEMQIPGNRSLHMLYTYYIYSHEDAPETPLGSAFVKFHGLVSHSSDPKKTDDMVQGYYGIQLSLMKYEDFFKLINPQEFCCSQEDIVEQRCEKQDQLLVNKLPRESYNDVDVYVHTIKFLNSTTTHAKDSQMRLRKTGVYILMFSNCGNLDDAVVSGSVVVKNPYGFLPGNEYYKMPFYGWLSVVYMLLSMMWMALSIRWWKELFNIQNCVSVVILLGLIESFLWYVFYNDWNEAGTRGKLLFVLGILASVVKSVFSYMLVLVASLGWGVTRPFLDQATVIRIQAISCLYIVLEVVREVVLSFRHSHSLPLAFVLLCLLPVSLLNGVIFYWVFTALSSLIEALKDRRQFEKLILFQRLWTILICTLATATITLLYQIFNLSRSIATRWMHQWLFTDGVSHILFLVVLAAMMYLWAPHKYSQRYAYSQQIDDHEPDLPNEACGKILGPDSWIDEANKESVFADDLPPVPPVIPISSAQGPASVIGAGSASTVLQDTIRDLDMFSPDEEAIGKHE